MPERRVRLLLCSILAVAFVHALIQARVRPLYQVSDEMSYVLAAQQTAREGAEPPVARCVSPPDGTLLTGFSGGGKRGYRIATGWSLRTLCASGGTFPLFALRALQALAFPVLAWSAWSLGRLLGGPRAGLIAAFVIAVHPIAAKYSGGVTPDAWANAMSGAAFVAGARLLLDRGRWWDLAGLALCTSIALAWKETTYGLLVHGAVVVSVVALRNLRPGVSWRPRLAALAVVAIALTGLGVVGPRLGSVFGTAYSLPTGRSLPATVPAAVELARDVLTDAAGHVPAMIGSGALSMYRPWVYRHAVDDTIRQPLTPALPVAFLTAASLLGLIGLVWAWLRGATPAPMVVVAWTSTAVLTLLQPSVRQVLLGSDDLHQGRWLFPLLAPAAALIGVGLARVTSVRALPLVWVAGLSAIAIGILDMVRHYYVSFPAVFQPSSLFVRPTGDYNIGDDRILSLVREAALTSSPSSLVALVALGMAAGVMMLVTTAALARQDLP